LMPEAMQPTVDPTLPRGSVALVLLAAAILYLPGLGSTDVWAPDEPRIAAVAEEMRSQVHGRAGLVVLHLNGSPYTQKPPLYYWLAAMLGSPLGRVGEVAARLPSALAGLVCIWLTLRLGTALSRRPEVGLWSAAVLLTAFRFGHLARRAQLDVLLTLFVLIAFFALWNLTRDDDLDRGDSPASGRRTHFFALHIALALGVLTKGPVALLPIAAFAIYLAWQGRLAFFSSVFPPWSFIISFGPGLLWIGATVALTPAGYFEEAVIDNIFGRFFTGTTHIRPLHYYLTRYPREFLPWSLLWPYVGWRTWRAASRATADRERSVARFLIVWIAVWFIFFSLSAGKRGLYLLPTFPALAVLCGTSLADSVALRTRLPRAFAGILLAVAAAVFGLACGIIQNAGFEIPQNPGFVIPSNFGTAVASILTLGALAYGALTYSQSTLAKRALVLMIAVGAIELAVFCIIYPSFDHEKSPRPIAMAALKHSPQGAPIAVFSRPDLVGGVAYYSGRKVFNVSSLDELQAFSKAGGRSVIVKASKLNALPPGQNFEIIASERQGERKLLVAVPTGPR
jgi:4-amino-4-deoxy-L-arabinose transferase-like glycosyltransferase